MHLFIKTILTDNPWVAMQETAVDKKQTCWRKPQSRKLALISFLFVWLVSLCCFSYVGHGAGARFLDGQKVLKQEMKAASLLFGCSSAALAVRGDLEGAGIILNYLMAGW